MLGSKLSRQQSLRDLPKHILFAVLCGTFTGMFFDGLLKIPLPGYAPRFFLSAPMAGVFVYAATLPLALPGKHLSFAFICGSMLLLLVFAASIVSRHFSFQHSTVPGLPGTLMTVNFMTVTGIAVGGCLGLFYGILAGQRSAMWVGLALGSATGYLLGVLSAEMVSHAPQNWDKPLYSGWLHLAWQGAATLGLLHLGAGLGAALGAEAQARSKAPTQR